MNLKELRLISINKENPTDLIINKREEIISGRTVILKSNCYIDTNASVCIENKRKKDIYKSSNSCDEVIWRINNNASNKSKPALGNRKSLPNACQDFKYVRHDWQQIKRKELIKINKCLINQENKINTESNEHEDKENMKMEWRLISKIVDRLLLYLFVLFTFFILALIINQV